MLSRHSFNVLTVQASVDTLPNYLKTGAFVAHFLRRFGDRFDADPAIRNMTPGQPHILLINRERTIHLQASATRIDLFRKKSKEEDEIVVDEHLQLATEIYRSVITDLGGQILKLICVTSQVQRHDDPGKELTRYFCRDQFCRDPFQGLPRGVPDFEIKFARQYFAKTGLPINNILVFKSGSLLVPTPQGDKEARAITALQDVATINVDQVLPLEKVGEFFGSVPEQYKMLFDFYLPAEEIQG